MSGGFGPGQFKKDDDRRSIRKIAADILSKQVEKDEGEDAPKPRTFAFLLRDPFGFSTFDTPSAASEALQKEGLDGNLWYDALRLNMSLNNLRESEHEIEPQDIRSAHGDIIGKSLLILDGLKQEAKIAMKNYQNEIRETGQFANEQEQELPDEEKQGLHDSIDNFTSGLASGYYHAEYELKQLENMESDFRALADKIGIELIEPPNRDDDKNKGRGR